MEKNKSILIVDDDQSIQRTLTLIFNRKGYHTDTAGTGWEAINKANEKLFNIALLDLRLPDVTGVELIEPLKKTNPDIVLILATGYASVESAVEAVNQGATAYITKPLNMDHVLTTIEQAMEKQRLEVENKRLYEQARVELAERKRAEQEVRRLKEFNENIVQNMTEGIFIEYSDGTITFANPTMAAMLGYWPDELNGRHWTKVVPSDQYYLAEAANERRRQGISDQYEIEMLCKNGSRLPVLVSAAPQFDSETTEYVGNLVVITDISERVASEKALKESEQRYLNLFRNVPVSIWEEDLSEVKNYIDGLKAQGINDLKTYFYQNPGELDYCASLIRLLDVNDYTLTLFQAKDKRHLLDNLGIVHGPGKLPVLVDELVTLDSGKYHYEIETIKYTLSGNIIHTSLRTFIPPEAESSWSRYLVSITDISEMVRNETALKQSVTRYANLFENVPVSLWENDYSKIKAYIDSLKNQGIKDIKSYFEENPDALVHCSSLIHVLDVNEYTLLLYRGKDKQHFLKNVDSIFGPERFGVLFEEILALESGKYHYATETVNYTLSGEPIFINLRMTVPQEAKETWSLLLVSVTDISERIKAEKEIRHRAELMEALNDIISAAIASPDLESLLETALDRTLKALNLKTGTIWIPPTNIKRNFPPKLYELMQQHNELLCSGNKINVTIDWQQVKGEREILKPVMETFGIKSSISIAIPVEGMPFTCFGVLSEEKREWSAEEITLMEAAGRQLGAAVERFNLLETIQGHAYKLRETINTAPEGMFLLDADSKVIMANPIAEECLQILARYNTEMVLTHLGDRPLGELIQSPPPRQWHTIELKKASKRFFELIARPMEKDKNDTEHVLVIREVTRQREADQYIQRQERLAAVGQLAAGIAHDFNNIMAVIILYSQLTLRLPDISPAIKERTTIIEKQGRRATELIQQILDFSRRSVLELHPLELLPLVKEVTKLLERMLPENIRIELNTSNDQFTINADPTRVQQALMNLAVNARDAMPSGGQLEISLKRIKVGKEETPPLPEMETGEWVLLKVLDSGIGIPDEARLHIFEPFFTTKQPGAGTGLGLAQVYGIVMQHDGHINVESTVGEGTCFSIYLPALLDKESEITQEKGAMPFSGSGQTILVVEDNTVTRKAIVECLTQLDYNVLEAENGKQALEIVEKRGTEITLALTDLVMPVMSGIELANQIRTMYPNLKLLFMSGYSEKTTMSDDKKVPLLTKPFTIDSLINKIREVIKE